MSTDKERIKCLSGRKQKFQTKEQEQSSGISFGNQEKTEKLATRTKKDPNVCIAVLLVERPKMRYRANVKCKHVWILIS